MLIAVGLALYPMGWDNIEVLQACGGVSKPYHLGKLPLFLNLLQDYAALLAFYCVHPIKSATNLAPEGRSLTLKRSLLIHNKKHLFATKTET